MAVCKRDNEGMSLLEVTMAVAIFAVVIGITAQSLGSYYVSIDLHEQRIEAAQAARTVLAACREKCKETKDDFPAAFLAWVEDQQDDGWQEFLRADDKHLAAHALNVETLDSQGEGAQADDNPIVVRVTSSWDDRRGRAMRSVLVTAFTDQ
jgi:prepilin-type N-terminal cleavage/methylation domain-containing protein